MRERCSHRINRALGCKPRHLCESHCAAFRTYTATFFPHLVRPLEVPRPPWADESYAVVPPSLWQWWVFEGGEHVKGLASSPERARQGVDALLARPQ